MRRLRRAFGILAGTEADGVPAHFVAEAQISERSTAAVSRSVKTGQIGTTRAKTRNNFPRASRARACMRGPKKFCLMQFILH
jgi:hypothetical protein